jgi:predicted amidophosphoribosyltransferase
MISLKEKLSTSSFRLCIRCGGFSLKGTPLYCDYCFARLNRARSDELLMPADLKFPVYALYTWTPTNDSILRPMLYSLKGGRCVEQFKNLALEFSLRIKKCHEESVLVVPPRKNQAASDHALTWAMSLAQLWNFEICDCLILPKGFKPESQKQKSVESRLEREFSLVKNAKFPRKTRIVFADDILTTGSTARAAFKALGEPKNFEVWAIAWRPKLATKSAI